MVGVNQVRKPTNSSFPVESYSLYGRIDKRTKNLKGEIGVRYNFSEFNNIVNDQISKTNISEIKIVLSELAKSETQKIMLSKSSPEYVFKTIDKAFAPEIKISPRRSIICIIGALVGFSLSLLISILLRLRKEKNSS